MATRKAASACSSEMFLGMTMPSHHRVVAGLPPATAAGAAARPILPTTVLSAGLSSAAARVAQRLDSAILPCWNCFWTKVDSETRYSGSM